MDDVFTKSQLIDAFRTQASTMPAFLATVPDAVFARGSTTDWSPAHHVEHLINVASKVAGGMANRAVLPPRSPTPSRDFATIRDTYLATLAQVPADTLRSFGERAQLAMADDVRRKEQTIARFTVALTRLADAIEPWSDRDLDTHGMPHPILGVLSVREMLLFALYHNTHHERGISRLFA